MKRLIISYNYIARSFKGRKFFTVNVSPLYFRTTRIGPCKDVTLGDCTYKKDDISDIIFSPDASNCQSVCNIFADCFFFHFDRSKKNENCVLLKESYRQRCESIASPIVNITSFNLVSKLQ